ncbi:spore protease YyaC [Paenibacillus senegalensis]|uniref:spore protease YyaC n=1 Tax=Paenibacillus senegalensis TaxID=1465766 RepID=UPI000287C69F|nr:spore protease YyaC [Paenibacillus senegalensis]
MNFSFKKDKTPSVESLMISYNDQDCSSTLSARLSSYFQKIPVSQPLVFVCIGTDRSTGDALGPLVGSKLASYNISDFPVYGTLAEPVHALNLADTLAHINNKYNNPFIVGIDACLGQLSSVGSIKIGDGPLKPGAGVNKDLPQVGDIHITGVVNVGGFMEYFVLQNTRLYLVSAMADVISHSILLSLPYTERLSATSAYPSSP